MPDYKPTADNIEAAKKLWRELELDKVDGIVRDAFRIWRSNTDHGEVKAKIGVLNALWEAGVLDVGGWAGRIVTVAGGSDFGGRLRSGRPDLLRDVAHYRTSRGDNPRCNRVAASKYLHFSNPDGFPIWDSVAIGSVQRIDGMAKGSRQPGQWFKCTRVELASDYEKWCGAIKLLCEIRTPAFTYKEMDQYLWLLGYAWDLDPGSQPDESAHWLAKRLWGTPNWQRLLPPARED